MSIQNETPKYGLNLPKISFGNFPTPLQKLDSIGRKFSRNNLFVKCDNCSGNLYGGNKVRKLEYLLADARKQNAKRLITSGFIGSNHALATALYGRKYGFNVTLTLFGIQKGDHVCKNLVADYQSGADIVYYETYDQYQHDLPRLLKQYEYLDGTAPYLIPAGGTSPIGVAGYVNAAFELKTQLDTLNINGPITIFVPFGTMGTVAGLTIGLKASGIKGSVVAVSVVPSFVASRKALNELLDDSIRYFTTVDSSFSHVRICDDDYMVDNDQFGEGYGISTIKTDRAIELFKQQESIALDSVYSGKAAASFLDYIANNINDDHCIFWNTKSSVPFTQPEGERPLPDWLLKLLERCK
jgi:1-aminocyclopropane-1-carboxylate deaminase/D-cysteine desulfhydrase-like pyridoxal-dependent ACC family enzyme